MNIKTIKKIAVFVIISGLLLGCGAKKDRVSVNIGSLKGPTSIGLVKLMEDSENNKASNDYNFTMGTAADELLPLMIKGELDIALVPANVASVLYNKTDGQVVVLDINTLGVLYAVSGDKDISTVDDLKGRTLYITGKGTTPDYLVQYLLKSNNITLDDISIEYKSEPAEVAATLKEHPEGVGILPQPFVTAACIQNDKLSVVLDLTNEWDNINSESGSKLVTGVTVARKDFVENNKAIVESFMAEHKASADYILNDVDGAAALVVKTGIIEKEPIAVKAIPNCNITYIDGEEMKKALSGYLKVLFDMDPTTVGGALPNEDFYY